MTWLPRSHARAAASSIALEASSVRSPNATKVVDEQRPYCTPPSVVPPRAYYSRRGHMLRPNMKHQWDLDLARPGGQCSRE
mmetsp:Transcript_15585/g.40308  ORF Transcript_15585/g.40308 Transcript_15585/m.40308 type:complete len:81 (-) Transcript_15585:634-876(-)